MTSGFFSRPRVALAAALSAMIVSAGVACDAISPRPVETGKVTMQLVLPRGGAASVGLAFSVKVSITGLGIATPIDSIFFFDATGTSASGSMTVPVGQGRLMTVSIYDATNALLFMGTSLVNVTAGVNPPATVTISPTLGSVPITVVFGTVTVTLSPPPTIRAGLTTTITATVKDGLGVAVPGAVVLFATNAPPTAWAATGGVVTGLDAGTALISATSLGSSATAAITVTAGTALDLVTIAPATATAASGATITASVTVRDVSVPGVDSISISIMAAASLPITCKATAPFSGTRADGVFRCNATLPVGAALGAWAPSQLKIYWGGPAGGGGGSTTFTPELLNARGVTAAVTVTP